MAALERDVPPAATAPAGTPLVRVRDVAVTHAGADRAAPASVSFTLSPGEVLLVLGPSGCGKSTLALTLDGLIPHDIEATVDGTVEVLGLDAARSTPAELSTRVGTVFQDPDAQLVTGTVLDEVAFGPENLRMPVADVLARAQDALTRVGLWERRGENPDRLSGGGRQRLALACALAMGSPVLVLDEPTANLDPRGIDEVYATLADVVAARDRAIVLVEHNLDAAMDVVDRVLVLDADGRVVADGSVDDVLRRDADQLNALGVWLPTSALAALRLRDAGFVLDPLPLTPDELRAALESEAGPGDPATSSPDAASGGVAAHRSAPRPDHGPESPTRRGADPLISVRGLTVDRGRRRILEPIDLDVRAGEFAAVVGRNGAGKTTLLQAIAGVRRPPRGTVHVDGLDVGRVDTRRLSSRIGFVFQNPEHQFIAHTVFDEIAHGLRRRRLPEDEVRARTDDLLARFGLTDKADLHPFLLSGGQKRRLSVGTALVTGAPVLALDEPTFGQDRARADELMGLLRELNRAGTTILIVTHDMQLVAEYAERTLVLSQGRLLRDGPASEVLADDALLDEAGLRPPPLRRALRGLSRHPHLARAGRLADLPSARPADGSAS